MSTTIYPAKETTAQAILKEVKKLVTLQEAATMHDVVTLHDWAELRAIVEGGMAPEVLPVGTRISDELTDVVATPAASYQDCPWDVVRSTASEILLEMHHALPTATEFSPQQAFLYAIDGLPAGTYHVTVSGSTTTYERAPGDYQFTLTNDLPAGGQLAGFFAAGKAASVKAYSSPSATSATETCEVTSGSGGTALGTFTAAGISVPASGTPESAQSVTINDVAYTYYGLNGWQRVSYGNNRALHSPLYQWLNSDKASNWWVPKSVFDRPPTYVGKPGFLTALPAGLVEQLATVTRRVAVSYLCDGGSSAEPVVDEIECKMFLPSWEEQYLAVSGLYGGSAGLEGTAWEYWVEAKGTENPPAAGSTNVEYIRTKLSDKTAVYVFLQSCNRGNGGNVACVSSAGVCGNAGAYTANRVAPACAIRKSE